MTVLARTPRRLAVAAALGAVAVLGGAAVAGAATPSPSVAADETEQERDADEAEDEGSSPPADRPGRGAAGRPPAVTGPAFICDPALSHGQNVSAYARSLPKGPGRGRLVSQAARSDCGKPSADD